MQVEVLMDNPTLTLPISSVTVYRPSHGPDEIHIVAPLPSPFMCDENTWSRNSLTHLLNLTSRSEVP